MLKTFETYMNNYVYNNSEIVKSAVLYATVASGKRIRPLILLSLLKDYNIGLNKGLAPALAVEMIHSYSLVHDDLPAMDNDDYRRGKLSTHKKYGEATAILAGDALLTEAFVVLANDAENNDTTKINLIKLLGEYAGISGMIYGQELDLSGENKELSITDINRINEYKTANLIMYSTLAAATIANKQDDITLLKEFALNLGIAFQVQDDIFDVSKSFEDLGKLPSDAINNKSTYVKLVGLKKAEEYLEELFAKCFAIIEDLELDSNNLYNLLTEIKLRNN